MKNRTRLFGALAALALPLVLPVFGQEPPRTEPVPSTEPAPDAHAWPRVFEGDGLKLTVYQPHLESWDYFQLSARAAVSVETGGGEPVFGAVWFSARTHVNKEQRLVTCEEMTLPRASFPTAADRQDAWLAALRPHFQGGVRIWHLDRLEASLAVLRAEKRSTGAPIKNDPPRIIFSGQPSILVLVDGVPVLQPAGAGGLLRVVNTRGLILNEPGSGRFYLALHDRWLVARSLNGTWSCADHTPEGAVALRDAAVAAGQVDLFDQDQEIVTNLGSGVAPSVYTSSEPAELIETQGEPDLVPIPGTNLRWIKNTTGDLFFDASANVHYVLISGRWFRSATREGPWTFVAGSDLPEDFRRIPASDPASEILTSVPGTPAADEAAIENDVPQTATVRRADATIDVEYDGEPDLQPIEGTTCRYVSNCQTPIVVVNDDYYACQDGIWFSCHGPRGRWLCCESVPPIVYTIPPSCPIHYVTYTRIYRSTPDYVYVGYTPGYLGTCVSHDGCVVWGTGFRHRPWVGKVWIGRPCTYGFAVGVHSCSSGFGVGIGVGVRVANRPWWGPLSKPHPVIEEARRDGHRDIHANNADIYHHWNAAVVRPAPMPEHHEEHRDERSPARPNNVYATPDGNVARRASDGSWERHDGGTWKATPAASAPAQHQDQQRQLEAEHTARERGNARVQAQQQPRSSTPEPSRSNRGEPRPEPPLHPNPPPPAHENPPPREDPPAHANPPPSHPNPPPAPPSHSNPPPPSHSTPRAPSSPAPGVRGGSTRH